MAKLTLRDLEMTYEGGVRAVDGLDLTVADGELMVLLGPSGSGKTTTLRIISGLLRPTAGDVLFDDLTVLAVPPERRGVVLVFQDNALFPFRTVAMLTNVATIGVVSCLTARLCSPKPLEDPTASGEA